MPSYCQYFIFFPFYFLLQLLLDFEKCKTWEEKLDIFLSYVPNNKISLSVEDTKALCTTIYMHILILRKFDLSSLEQIRSSITLLKPTLQFVSMTEEDYGLHKVLYLRILFTNIQVFNFPVTNLITQQ